MNDTPNGCGIGLIGLAVMGQNLALNIARHGYPIAVYNRTTAVVDAFLADDVQDEPVTGCRTVADFCASLARPRRVILMVKAGAPVDDTIAQLLPHLDAGDLIIDAGNSHPDDTERRSLDLTARGFQFMGMGVSGGEEGALNGPSLMPGGPRDAYDALEPMLRAIAAVVDGEPCVTYIGPGAAGHFVKMVHNGIEYGDMQLIAEAYDLLHRGLGMTADHLASTFRRWNEGVLESYLIEITGAILAAVDTETGKPMVEVILDRAGQKGTGRWTAEIALRLGVPLPTIHAAVDARGLSARKAQRVAAAAVLQGPDDTPIPDRRLVDDVHDALYASKICSYAQGLDLLAAASAASSWDLDLAAIARIWRGGCIIRARFLDVIAKAFTTTPKLDNLLLHPDLGGWIVAQQRRWREVIAVAADRGIPVLAMASSLAYFDSYRCAQLPQNLTQAQRDYFGAHTYERVDKPEGEWFHSDWSALGPARDA